jgi:hypothetical protein
MAYDMFLKLLVIVTKHFGRPLVLDPAGHIQNHLNQFVATLSEDVFGVDLTAISPPFIMILARPLLNATISAPLIFDLKVIPANGCHFTTIASVVHRGKVACICVKQLTALGFKISFNFLVTNLLFLSSLFGATLATPIAFSETMKHNARLITTRTTISQLSSGILIFWL